MCSRSRCLLIFWFVRSDDPHERTTERAFIVHVVTIDGCMSCSLTLFCHWRAPCAATCCDESSRNGNTFCLCSRTKKKNDENADWTYRKFMIYDGSEPHNLRSLFSCQVIWINILVGNYLVLIFVSYSTFAPCSNTAVQVTDPCDGK